MKYQSLCALALCGLLLFTSAALSQKPTTATNKVKLERVSQNELNEVAEKLATTELQHYTHRVHSFDAKRVAKLDKETIVRGLFLMRKPEFMRRLSNGAFDDKQGSLIYFGRFKNDQGQDIPYSLTFAASGDVFLAFDFNDDGIVDGMIGKRSQGKFWELKNDLLPAFWACVESHYAAGIFGAPDLCLRRGNSRRGNSTGAEGRTGSGSVGRPRDSGASDLEGFVNELSNPDCSNPNPMGAVRESPKEERERRDREYLEESKRREEAYREQSEVLQARADEARRDGHLELAKALREAANYRSQQADAVRDQREARFVDNHEAWVKAVDRESRVERAYNRAYDRAGAEWERLHPGSVPPPRPRGGGVTTRPIGPDGESEDPRCAGLQKEIAQGLWFADRRLCGGDDPITCYMRASDAVRVATQGRCHTEIGPNDAPIVVCRKTHDPQAETNEDPLAVGEPEPVPGPFDGPPRPALMPRGPRVNYDYVGTTPLGAVLALMCQADGGSCGPWEALKLEKPKL